MTAGHTPLGGSFSPPPEAEGFIYFYGEGNPRPVLNEEYYVAVVEHARTTALQEGGGRPSPAVAMAVVDLALAAVGYLAPPPLAEPDTCGAQWPDPEGIWRQCYHEPGHQPAERHSDGEFTWTDGLPNAIPGAAGPAL